jgi:hypothetical protein
VIFQTGCSVNGNTWRHSTGFPPLHCCLTGLAVKNALIAINNTSVTTCYAGYLWRLGGLYVDLEVARIVDLGMEPSISVTAAPNAPAKRSS